MIMFIQQDEEKRDNLVTRVRMFNGLDLFIMSQALSRIGVMTRFEYKTSGTIYGKEFFDFCIYVSDQDAKRMDDIKAMTRGVCQELGIEHWLDVVIAEDE